jgi:hypothetical protein
MLNPSVLSCLYELEGDPNDLLARTLKLPCTIPSAFPLKLLDGWTVFSGCDASKQRNTCDFHKGAYGCYRHAFFTTGLGVQACYDNQGR